MSLEEASLFAELTASLEQQFNQQLQADFTAVIQCLSAGGISNEVLKKIPVPEAVKLDIVSKDYSTADKIVNAHTCVGIKANGQRCTRNPRPGQTVCSDHSGSATKRWDCLDTCLSHLDAPKDVQIGTLVNRAKRNIKYTVPPDDKLSELYVPVKHLVIDGFPYLVDSDNGMIYSITHPLVLQGQMVDGTSIKWYV